MSLVALCSAKGSPGVTTAMLALARSWSGERQVLVAELDPAGGDLAARMGLPIEPGLLSLGAAARRDLPPAGVWEHAQALPGGTTAILGPASADQAHAALSAAAAHLGPMLATLPGTDVVADCGRAAASSPAGPILAAADLVLLVARPRADEIAHLHASLALLKRLPSVGVLLVGDRPYSADEVASVLGLPIIGVLADDQRGAALLNGTVQSTRGLRASSLLRTAREVMGAVGPRLGPPATPAPPAAEAPQSSGASVQPRPDMRMAT